MKSFQGKNKMPRKKKTEKEAWVEQVIMKEEYYDLDTTPKSSKKTKKKDTVQWPKVIIGSHSTRTEYEDGRVEFVTDWEALKRDVKQALDDFENSKK